MRLVLLLMLATSVAWAAGGLITPGRSVGPARLGARPPGEWGRARVKMADEKTPENRSPRYYWEYPEYGVWMLVQDDRILKIGVEGGTWKTDRGACLWMKADEVARRHGRGRTRRPENYDPKTPFPRYILGYPRQGLDFLVQEQSRLVEAIHVYPPRRD